MSQKEEIVAGLDVGTTKICLLIGERTGEGEIRVLAVGTKPSLGLRKGEVVNVGQTVESIQKALDQAESLCEEKIDSVCVGITGSHVDSFNSRAILPVLNPAAGVTRRDMAAAVAQASKVPLRSDQEIIHILPQDFSVDDRKGIVEPEGIQGSRLEAKVHLVTARIPAVDNIVNCVTQAGLGVAETVLQQLASSLAVMTDEEQESGAVLVDIGGGTTDYAFFRHGLVWHTRVLSVGGDHVTNDISLGLKLLIPQAEELKKKSARALADRLEEDQALTLTSSLVRSSGRLSQKTLCRIVELRLTEIFRLIRRDLEESGHFQNIGAGLILTGGGALLKDIDLLAKRETGLPVRIGHPIGVCGLREVIDSPVYSTAVGLVKYGLKQGRSQRRRRFLGGIRGWLEQYF